MKTRQAYIQDLVSRLRHHGLGQEEVYAEMAARLQDEHAYNRVFHDYFLSEPLSRADSGRLRQFYEDYEDGAFLPSDEE